jgi:hypothetical protein
MNKAMMYSSGNAATSAMLDVIGHSKTTDEQESNNKKLTNQPLKILPL